MSASRFALVLAITAAVSWGAKATAIGIAGGLDKSPLESPLFALGLLTAVATAAAAGIALTRGRPIVWRVIGAVGGLVAALLLALAPDAAAGVVVPDAAGWVQEEAGLWLSAAFIVVATLVIHRRQHHEPAA